MITFIQDIIMDNWWI